MKLTKYEQKIEYLKERLSTARTTQIMLLEQIIELKAENKRLLDILGGCHEDTNRNDLHNKTS
jgi:hypothetical protein